MAFYCLSGRYFSTKFSIYLQWMLISLCLSSIATNRLSMSSWSWWYCYISTLQYSIFSLFCNNCCIQSSFRPSYDLSSSTTRLRWLTLVRFSSAKVFATSILSKSLSVSRFNHSFNFSNRSSRILNSLAWIQSICSSQLLKSSMPTLVIWLFSSSFRTFSFVSCILSSTSLILASMVFSCSFLLELRSLISRFRRSNILTPSPRSKTVFSKISSYQSTLKR